MDQILRKSLAADLRQIGDICHKWADHLVDEPPPVDSKWPAYPEFYRPLDHATLFYRFDPRKDLNSRTVLAEGDMGRGDIATFQTTGWSYPNREKAPVQLRERNQNCHHLAYTDFTHFVRYEGLAWMMWADKNGVNREDAFYHAAVPGLTYSDHWNHSHSVAPDEFRAAYWQPAGSDQKRWMPATEPRDLKAGVRVWLGQVDPFEKIVVYGPVYSEKTYIVSPQIDDWGIYQTDRYLYWAKFNITDDGVYSFKAIDTRLPDDTIPVGNGPESRIDRKHGGPGDWLMNVSNPNYRRFILEDRPRLLDEIHREHRVADEKLQGEVFNGLYIDDAALDVIALAERGGFAEEFSAEQYWHDCATLCTELWHACDRRRPKSYVHCNVGNWKWRDLKHFARYCPSIYFDRMIHAGKVTEKSIAELADTLTSLESELGEHALVSIDGFGGDANCLDDERKLLFLCVYYLVCPNFDRYMFCMMQNGDSDRSDWLGRHWHNDVLTDIGEPVELLKHNGGLTMHRSFENAVVSIVLDDSGPFGIIEMR